MKFIDRIKKKLKVNQSVIRFFVGVLCLAILLFLPASFINLDQKRTLAGTSAGYHPGLNALIIDSSCSSPLYALYGAGVFPGEGQKFSIVTGSVKCGSDSSYNLPPDVDIYISSGGVIEVYSLPGQPFKAHNIYITNGSTLTHRALEPGDFEAGSRTQVERSGSIKRVELELSGILALDSGGKIDVSGKGYPGGTSSLYNGDGYGPGFSRGRGANDPSRGAGFGGYGGGYSSNEGLRYPDNFDTSSFREDQFYWGSGSGASFFYDSWQKQLYEARGARGGGRIHIKAKEIDLLSTNSYIVANGENGYASHGVGKFFSSGGGSGGYIWLESSEFSSAGGIPYSVAGGYGNAASGGGGFDSIDPSFFGVPIYNIFATGGIGGQYSIGSYGGGGGRLVLKSQPSCTLRASGGIPVNCEGKDVTIVGNGVTVYADWVTVRQSNDLKERTLCNDPNNAECDSKRWLNSLTIAGGAVLTHSPVTETNMSGDTDGDRSLADEKYGLGRWKKVDLEVDGFVDLMRGGKIDVNAKGYVAPLYEDNSAGCVDVGYGPGAGWSSLAHWIDINAGGGGSYGGKGAQSYYDSWCPPGNTYGDPNAPDDFGSNGGSCHSNRDHEGAPGGGRVKIIAKRLQIFDNLSFISANGGEGWWVYLCAYGAGSGGSIWLQVESLLTPSGGEPLSAAGGIDMWGGSESGHNGEDGTIIISPSINPPPNYTQIFAKGGDSYRNGGAGGGGRIKIEVGPVSQNLSFMGNLYSVNLQKVTSFLRVVQGGDIVANNQGACPDQAKWCITTNSNLFNDPSWMQKIKNNATRLKKYAEQVDNDNFVSGMPVVSDISNPEGKVYYFQATPRNPSIYLEKTTCRGYGTLIVEGGDVHIHRYVWRSGSDSLDQPECRLGVIALKKDINGDGLLDGGNIIVDNYNEAFWWGVGPAVHNMRGAFFAEGQINFKGNEWNDFKGMLVSPNIVLPPQGTFAFWPELAQTPPPGFREVFDWVVSETTP